MSLGTLSLRLELWEVDHDILLSREVSLSSVEKMGKQNRGQRFMQGIIVSQWQNFSICGYTSDLTQGSLKSFNLC